MTRYAALLRGVNVGGITLLMADVAVVFSDLGVADVTTVLASGNVLFDSDDAAATLKPRIEAALGARFGYEAWVHVVALAEIDRIVRDFPFDAERDGWHPYVIFASDAERAAELLDLAGSLDSSIESVVGGDGVVYWTVERGSTVSSTFGKALGRQRYKQSTTNRNLRTLHKLLRGHPGAESDRSGRE